MVVQIVKYFQGNSVMAEVASATVLEKGFFISYESNKAVVMDLVTDDATFLGICNDDSANGDTDDVEVLLKCEIRVDVVSATYSILQGLKYSAGSATVDYKLVDDGSANTIAFSLEEKTSAVTRLKVLIDVVALGKLAAVSA